MLSYSVTLEENEKALAPLRVLPSIPQPDDAWQEYCWPGQHERAEKYTPSSYYELEAPSHRGKSWPLRLPWRADNAYPEVEESFKAFRDAFEKMLAETYASQPIHEERSLSSSSQSRSHVAAGVLAERFLKAARRQQAYAV